MAKSATCWTRILANSRIPIWPINARTCPLQASSLRSRSISSKPQDEDSKISKDDEGTQADVKKREAIQQRLTEYEEEILANPYHRILASPLRRCIFTRNVLPKDLLIQLKPVFVPSEALLDQDQDRENSKEPPPLPTGAQPSPRSGMPEFFIPDGILHPRWNPKKPGMGAWFTADRKILREVIKVKASPLHLLSQWAIVPPRLEEMITYECQMRVLQEARILHELRTSNHELIQEESSGRPIKPLMLLDWESMQTPSSEGTDKQDVGLPLQFHLSELLDEDQHIPELRRLLNEVFFPSTVKKDDTVDGRKQDVLRIPARAVFGPLAVALWKLRQWQQS